MSHTKRTTSLCVRSFWFSDGRWWFRPHASKQALEISSLMRSTRYDSEALAAALRLGRRSFRRMVKESLEIPPNTWLRTERAVAVRHQLRAGHSVKQLATDYGFKHPGDFSAEFKRWYEVNPSEFVAHQLSLRPADL